MPHRRRDEHGPNRWTDIEREWLNNMNKPFAGDGGGIRRPARSSSSPFGFFFFLIGHTAQLGGIVTGLAHGRDQRVGAHTAYDLRSVFGEIHTCRRHAWHGAQCVLNSSDTAGTTHAGDG